MPSVSPEKATSKQMNGSSSVGSRRTRSEVPTPGDETRDARKAKLGENGSCRQTRNSPKGLRAGYATGIWSAPECLVLAVVADHEAERVRQEHLVRHILAKAVDN